MDISGLLGALERAGGYAAFAGILLVIAWYVANRLMTQQERREADMRDQHKSEIEREVRNAQEHREDKGVLIRVVQENSQSNAALTGAVQELAQTQNRTNERLIALDRHWGDKTAGEGR